MYGVVAIMPALYYVAGVAAIMDGDAYVVAAGALVTSPVAMWLIRFLVEQWPTTHMFSLKTQAWAFVIGDWACLPAALFFLTRGWRADGFFATWWWVLAAFLIGYLAMWLFGLIDAPRYEVAGATALLSSPTKIWHDWVAYPLLASLIIWSGIPQLAGHVSVNTVIALLLLLGWALCGLRDMKYPPNPYDQHPAWNSQKFQAV